MSFARGFFIFHFRVHAYIFAFVWAHVCGCMCMHVWVCVHLCAHTGGDQGWCLVFVGNGHVLGLMVIIVQPTIIKGVTKLHMLQRWIPQCVVGSHESSCPPNHKRHLILQICQIKPRSKSSAVYYEKKTHSTSSLGPISITVRLVLILFSICDWRFF